MSKAKILFRFFWNYFNSSGRLLFLDLFDLNEHGIKGHIEGLLKGFGALFNEEFVPGDLHTDLCNFIFDLVHYVVQLQKNIHVHDPVVVILQLADLLVNMFKEFDICFEMHTVNVDGHGLIFIGF
jgi:hypothetical protein